VLKIVESLWAVGAATPRTPLGEITALPDSHSWCGTHSPTHSALGPASIFDPTVLHQRKILYTPLDRGSWQDCPLDTQMYRHRCANWCWPLPFVGQHLPGNKRQEELLLARCIMCFYVHSHRQLNAEAI